MDQPHQADRRAHRDNSNVVLMSLYLLLLAFFILLNSLAQLEETRIKKAISSVKAEFRSDPAVLETGPAVPISTDLTPVAEDFHSEVRKFVDNTLPIGHVESLRQGDLLSVLVPTDDLFRLDEVAPRPRGRAFLDALAASLNRDRPGLRVEVEMAIGTGITLPSGGQDRDVTYGAFEMRRASGLAHALRRRGVAAAALRIGLIAGDPGQISFIFQIQDEAQSRMTFSDLVESQ